MSSVSNIPARPRRQPADAPTFVLVHGSGTSSFMWAPVQRELALRGHRSFAVDLPGHGFDAQYPVAYQAPQDLDAWANEPSTLAGVTLGHLDRRDLREPHRIGYVSHESLVTVCRSNRTRSFSVQLVAWNRQQLANQLRSLLCEYFPAAIKAFQVKNIGLTSREARTVLAAASTPAAAAKLSLARLAALLRRSGRQRNINTWAERLHAEFRQEQMR